MKTENPTTSPLYMPIATEPADTRKKAIAVESSTTVYTFTDPTISDEVLLTESKPATIMLIFLYMFCFYTSFLVKYLAIYILFISDHRFLGFDLQSNIAVGIIYGTSLLAIGGIVAKIFYLELKIQKNSNIHISKYLFIASIVLAFLSFILSNMATCIKGDLYSLLYLLSVEVFLSIAYGFMYILYRSIFIDSVRIISKYSIYPLLIIGIGCFISGIDLLIINPLMNIEETKKIMESFYLCNPY